MAFKNNLMDKKKNEFAELKKKKTNRFDKSAFCFHGCDTVQTCNCLTSFLPNQIHQSKVFAEKK